MYLLVCVFCISFCRLCFVLNFRNTCLCGRVLRHVISDNRGVTMRSTVLYYVGIASCASMDPPVIYNSLMSAPSLPHQINSLDNAGYNCGPFNKPLYSVTSDSVVSTSSGSQSIALSYDSRRVRNPHSILYHLKNDFSTGLVLG